MPTLASVGYNQRKHDRMVKRIKKIDGITIKVAIEKLVLGYCNLYDLDRPSVINQGMCEDFAHDVKSIIPEAQPLWDDELNASYNEGPYFHCVIRYQNKWYDSECPEGVNRWINLPFFQRYKSYRE